MLNSFLFSCLENDRESAVARKNFPRFLLTPFDRVANFYPVGTCRALSLVNEAK